MKIPPQAIDIEESIVGSMMLDAECVDVAMEALSADDFYSPDLRRVYKAVSGLVARGKPVDMMTVEQEMKKSDYQTNIADLARNMVSPDTCRHYCQIVKEKAMLRSMILACNQAMERSYELDADVYQVADDLFTSVTKGVNVSGGTLHDIVDTMTAVTQEIEQINKEGKPLGIGTGLDIDDILHGFQRGKLYIIGARPSMGKTALIMTMIREMAVNGVKGGVISLETSHTNLGVRLASQVSGIPAEHLMSGQMNNEEIELYNKASQDIARYGIYIDDAPGITIQQLHSKCSQMSRKGVQVIFIDFLTLVKSTGRSRHEEVGEVSKTCKNIAKELNIPIVLLSQLSRKVEERNNKRPMMSDIRESGSIEEDADGILFLYRPEYYGVSVDEMGNSTEGIAEVIIAKNKDGKTGVKRQYFEKETMTFKNLAHASRSTNGSPF